MDANTQMALLAMVSITLVAIFSMANHIINKY